MAITNPSPYQTVEDTKEPHADSTSENHRDKLKENDPLICAAGYWRCQWASPQNFRQEIGQEG